MVKKYIKTYILEWSDEAFLDKLKEETGLESDVKVFDEALSLYKWAVDKSKEGYRIVAINDAGKKDIILKSDTLEKLLKEKHKGREENVETGMLSLDEMLQLAGKVNNWCKKDSMLPPIYLAMTKNLSVEVIYSAMIESFSVEVIQINRSLGEHEISVKYGDICLGEYNGRDQRLKKLYKNIGLKYEHGQKNKVKAALNHARNLLKEGGEK